MSEIGKIVRDTFRRTIQDGPYPTEFKRALKIHERIPAFFGNLVREFSKPGLNPSRETIENATRDMTKLFVQLVHQQAEERIMSPLKQALLKDKVARLAEMRKLSDAIDQQGEANEKVTQDKAGNEISRAQIKADGLFQGS